MKKRPDMQNDLSVTIQGMLTFPMFNVKPEYRTTACEQNTQGVSIVEGCTATHGCDSVQRVSSADTIRVPRVYSQR